MLAAFHGPTSSLVSRLESEGTALGEAATSLSYWLQGGLPVTISMTVHATDQMSAARP